MDIVINCLFLFDLLICINKIKIVLDISGVYVMKFIDHYDNIGESELSIY